MKKKNYCIDCNKKITYYAKRCRRCNYIYLQRIGKSEGKNNSNYIDGRTNRNYFCSDCGKELKNIYAKRCKSCSQKLKWKKYREKYPKKICNCIDCKKEIKCGSKRCIKCHNINQKGSKRPKQSKSIGGKNHWNYKNGLSKEPYPMEFNGELKEQIRKRDNYECQGKNCSIIQEEHFVMYGRDLEVHHIDYDKENCKEENLVTTCKQCNIRANYNREYWKKYFREKITILQRNKK